MYYIDNTQLSILLRLLMGGDIVINAHDSQSLDELRLYVSTLDSLFREEPKSMTIEEEEEFEESYKPCITYKVSKSPYTITISCNSHDRLRQYLTEYARLFEEGELQEYGCRNVFELNETLEEELVSTAENTKTSKTRYKLTDIRFAPLILCKYLVNEEFIKSLTITLFPEGDIEYPIRLYEYDSSEEITGLKEDWQDNFLCLYELNIAWYLEEFNKKKSETVTIKRRTKYSPQQYKIFKAIIAEVERTKIFAVDPDYLMNKCRSLNKSNIDMAISRLNAVYREINNTDKILLRKRRRSGFYDVLPNFIPPEEN